MDQVLSSWKEIATFFGKGVRTVQRWERDLQLPVYRPAGGAKNMVIARTGELSKWMTQDIRLQARETKIALLLEKNAELRDGLRSYLEKAGYVVILCSRQPQAGYILNSRIKVDLFVASVELKEQSGVDLAHEFTESHPEAQVILTSQTPILQPQFAELEARGWTLISNSEQIETALLGNKQHQMQQEAA